jgi:hypothetical protein
MSDGRSEASANKHESRLCVDDVDKMGNVTVLIRNEE